MLEEYTKEYLNQFTREELLKRFNLLEYSDWMEFCDHHPGVESITEAWEIHEKGEKHNDQY